MAPALSTLSRLAAPADQIAAERIGDARESFNYWTDHASQLPWHRRSQRRHARAMIATARARLICAHLEQWGLGRFERPLLRLFDSGGRSGGAHVRALAVNGMRRTAIGRRILISAAAIATAMTLGVAAVAVFAVHLIAS